MPKATETTSEMQECIDNCSECSNVCLQTISHCLSLGGKPAESNQIQLLAECAEICRASAKFLCLGSKHYRETCGLCAEICEECAEECERVGGDDEQMKQCAKICRTCAQSCQEMAGETSAARR
jgi:hypothetical protein